MSTPSTPDLLPAELAMGPVTLRVADLDAMTAFYRDAVTLTVLSAAGDRVVLGRGQEPILVLEHTPGLKHAGPRQAGLFHVAILFETEADLAAALYSVATRYPGSFTGSADHLVSEAFYFDDPEGNGLEMYWDRARTEWRWTNGRVDLASLRLDPNQYLERHLDEDALRRTEKAPATVGHVHLAVGDVASARRFYVDQLGFEITAELGDQALFVSAAGYHHHMAMNTWTSRGARHRRLALGLGLVRIDLPTTGDVLALTDRLRHHGIETRSDGRTVSFDDPWLNRIEVSAAAEGPAV